MTFQYWMTAIPFDCGAKVIPFDGSKSDDVSEYSEFCIPNKPSCISTPIFTVTQSHLPDLFNLSKKRELVYFHKPTSNPNK
jgi:hypothetical protein